MRLALEAVYSDNTCPFVHRPESGGIVLRSGEADFFGNFGIGLSRDGAVEAASRTLAEGLAMIIVPGPLDPGLESDLAPFGFVHGGEIPAMKVALDGMPSPKLPDAYTFERLSSADDGEDWAKTLSESYPVAPLAARSMSPVHVRTDDAADAPLQFFRIRSGDETVGVSLLAMIDGLAGIYCVGTMPDHRRKGLGAVLTAGPLAVARDLGLTTGVLQSSEAGYSVYRGLGFEDDGAVQLYVRVPEGAEGH
ncbi:MAG: GNAT family N-acetyltransferase [Armatimonadetes bacterium]|nr:GNAT family N-acetyltransferase [Armatimonadota bacterium]